MTARTLTPEDVAAIAEAVVRRLRQRGPAQWRDAEEVVLVGAVRRLRLVDREREVHGLIEAPDLGVLVKVVVDPRSVSREHLLRPGAELRIVGTWDRGRQFVYVRELDPLEGGGA
jgi:hypothetical protein